MPDMLVPLPFIDPDFKRRSIDAVSQIAAAHGGLLKFALPFGGEAWLAASHALASQLLVDPRLSKASPHTDRSPPPHRLFHHLLVTDPPEHGRLRRPLGLALAGWTGARIAALAQTVVARHLASIDERQFDLCARIAMPAALEIACTIVGIPSSDMHRVQAWNDRLTAADLAGDDTAQAIGDDIEAYLSSLATGGALPPGSAMAVLNGVAATGEITASEAMALAYLLLSAGYETTGHLLASAVWLLTGDREVWRAIAADEDAARRAVEECLRFNPSLELATPRYAREDLEIDGCAVRRGEMIFVALGAANRDPAMIADGARFDCARAESARHLAFGRGPHICPGAGIARVAARTILQELARRYPKLTPIVGPDGAAWLPGLVMRGLRTLPVSLDGG
ncbi:MAG: cytochrome P450 [Sphingopyxis sp.]